MHQSPRGDAVSWPASSSPQRTAKDLQLGQPSALCISQPCPQPTAMGFDQVKNDLCFSLVLSLWYLCCSVLFHLDLVKRVTFNCLCLRMLYDLKCFVMFFVHFAVPLVLFVGSACFYSQVLVPLAIATELHCEWSLSAPLCPLKTLQNTSQIFSAH